MLMRRQTAGEEFVLREHLLALSRQQYLSQKENTHVETKSSSTVQGARQETQTPLLEEKQNKARRPSSSSSADAILFLARG